MCDAPVSILVGVAAFLVYSTLSVLAFALKAHIDISTQRILRAMEVLSRDNDDHPTAGGNV